MLQGTKEACLTTELTGKNHNSLRTTVRGQIWTVIDICLLDIALFSQLRHRNSSSGDNGLLQGVLVAMAFDAVAHSDP